VLEDPKVWRDRLEAGDIDRLVRQAGKHLPASAASKKSMLKRFCETGHQPENSHWDWYSQRGHVIFSQGSRHMTLTSHPPLLNRNRKTPA
jgi:hypothetical protein